MRNWKRRSRHPRPKAGLGKAETKLGKKVSFNNKKGGILFLRCSLSIKKLNWCTAKMFFEGKGKMR